MPSFQSPLPKSGSPCEPTVRPLSIARTQCSKTVASSTGRHGLPVRFLLTGPAAARRPGTAAARRVPRCRPWPTHTPRRQTAATTGRPNTATAGRGRWVRATSAGRRPPGTAGPPPEGCALSPGSGRANDNASTSCKLIAEPIGAARLVVAAPRPQPATHVLIEQPAVHQDVERIVGRAHRRSPGACDPSPPSTLASAATAASTDPWRAIRARAWSSLSPWPSTHTTRCDAPGCNRRPPCARRRTGSSPAPKRDGRVDVCRPAGADRVPLRPMNKPRSPVAERTGSLTRANATRPAKSAVVGIGRQHRAGRRDRTRSRRARPGHRAAGPAPSRCRSRG